MAVLPAVAAKVTVDYQGTADVDGVYVRGSSPEGSGSRWGIAGGGLLPPRSPARMTLVDAPQATDGPSSVAASLVELARRQNLTTVTVVVTGVDGWAKGQSLLITSAAYGWTAKAFVITAVNMRVMSGTGLRQYTLTAGTDPISFRARLKAAHAASASKPVSAPRVVGTLVAGGTMPDS